MSGSEGFMAVTTNIDTAGSIVWWRLSGILRHNVLKATWIGEGLDEDLLPKPTKDKTALSRALKELERGNKHRLIRKLQTGGWAIVNETAQGDDLDYAIDCRVEMNGAGPKFDPEFHPIAPEVFARFQHNKEHLTQTDVSSWLTKLTDHVRAVSLRDTGGVYFIPREKLPTWEKMVKAIRMSSAHVIHKVPALKSEEAVEAILDAITREAQAEVEGLENALVDDGLGERALTNRAAKCDDIRQKLETYEGLLGKSLDGFKNKMEDLKANLAAAALIAGMADPDQGELEL